MRSLQLADVTCMLGSVAVKKIKTIYPLFDNIAENSGLSVWRDRTRGQKVKSVKERSTLQIMYQIILNPTWVKLY